MFADAGISNYIAQTEKFGMGVSDGPIYSTIDATSDDMRTFNGAFSQHTTPYATTPVIPYGATHLHSPDEEESPWNTQPGISSIQYAQPERSRTESGTALSTEEAECPSAPHPPPPSAHILKLQRCCLSKQESPKHVLGKNLIAYEQLSSDVFYSQPSKHKAIPRKAEARETGLKI